MTGERALELVVAVESHHKRNLGPLIRTATVFGVSILLVVGPAKFGTHGAHGSNLRLKIVHFYTWDEARLFLKLRCPNGLLYGISEREYDMQESPTDSGLDSGATAHSQSNTGTATETNRDSKSSGVTKSVRLEDCAFAPLAQAFPSSEASEGADDSRGLVTFVVGAHKGTLSAEVMSFLDAAVHVEFPVPDVIDRLKFENVFSICLDHYVSFVINKPSSSSSPSSSSPAANGTGTGADSDGMGPFQAVSFVGEKFHVAGTLKSGDVDQVFAAQVQEAKKSRKEAAPNRGVVHSEGGAEGEEEEDGMDMFNLFG